MLKKTKETTKKRVHWDESVEDNEGKARTKRQKTEHTKREKEPFSLELIEGIKATIKEHFDNGTYNQLEKILNKFSLATRIKILSVDDYDLFLHAVITHNPQALSFIVKIVPEKTAYNMLHEGNLSPFRCFLYHTRTLEKLNKLNHQDRIEGFKIFLKIDLENVMKEFDDFDSKFSQTDPIKESVKKDFTTALTQLREEGIIPIEEPSIVQDALSTDEREPSKNALLKHLGDGINIDSGKTKLTLHSTTDHTTFNSIAAEESISSKLTETTKKVIISPNVSNASFKTL